MTVTTPTTTDAIASALQGAGYCFVHGEAMRPLVEHAATLADWDAFAASWDDLELDTYMADGGRYRRRRHGLYGAGSGAVTRRPDGPHYQALDYNSLNGGVERWFAPTTPAIGDSPSMMAILAWCTAMFGSLAPATREWWIETHQFRIAARPGLVGNPTPEGAHRDGVDFVLVLLVRRVNIACGVTSVYSPTGAELGSFTLTVPFDAALVDDHRVWHGVTAVEPIAPDAYAHRDVLVVTFRAQ